MVCFQAPPVYGGAGAQALALASRLMHRGCEVDLLTGNQLLAERRATVDGVVVLRAPAERLVRRLPRRPAEIVRTLLFATWLLYRLVRRRYDVYHVHGNYWFSLAPALIARLTRKPLVVKVTRLGDDDAETVARKRFGLFPLGWLYSFPTRSAAAVVALSGEIGRRHCSRFPRVPVLSLPNGVDVQRFAATPERRAAARAALEIPADAIVALFVGYVTSRKGVPELLEAWHELASRQGNAARRAILLIVGPESGVYRELDPEAGAAAAQRTNDGVLRLRHVGLEGMPSIYAAADVLVLPSRSEGMPNCVLEALAAGLGIVASRVPGVIEAAGDDPHTILLDSLDPPTIRAGLEAAIANAATTARPPRVPRSFALDGLAATYIHVYESLRESRDGDNRRQRFAELGHQW